MALSKAECKECGCKHFRVLLGENNTGLIQCIDCERIRYAIAEIDKVSVVI